MGIYCLYVTIKLSLWFIVMFTYLSLVVGWVLGLYLLFGCGVCLVVFVCCSLVGCFSCLGCWGYYGLVFPLWFACLRFALIICIDFMI